MFPQNDRVTLIKQDGSRFAEIPSYVGPDTIKIEDASIPIEEGDTFERVLPSGLVEKYLVLDRGFRSYPIPFYNVKIRKETTIAPETKHTTVIQQSGNNPRVNINSTDSSYNIVANVDLSTFESIKDVINTQIPEEQGRDNYLKLLNDLKDNVGKETYRDKYKSFINTIADHITIIAPFLPYLTNFIQ